MKIIVSGSLGHISKPLAQELVKKKHSVTVISSNEERRKAIEAIGANAAIGKMEDPDFLTDTFKDADVVYAMEAVGMNNYFDPNFDLTEFVRKICESYKRAIEESGVKKVVHLSSVGAHTDKENGILAFHFHAESILSQLPKDVSIKYLRPVGFYYNMFGFMQAIKAHGVIIQNYGGDEIEPWVSPEDIASVIAEEMERPFNGREVRYIASDEVSPNEVAQILGEAIGKPELKWQVVSDEQMLSGMVDAGMSPKIAQGLVEMNAARFGKDLYKDYHNHRPTLRNVKLKDFAKEFAIAYNSL